MLAPVDSIALVASAAGPPAMPASPLAIVVFALLGWIATHIVLRAVTARGVVDLPNHRSSHSTPTPRGGGLAFAVVGTLALVAVAIRSGTLAPWCIAAAGAALAAIGLRDDTEHVSPRTRLAAHLGAASLILLIIWPFGTLGAGVWLGLLLLPIAVVAIAWAISVVNFMDGLDGIAASQAILVAGGAAAIFAGGPAAAPAAAAALVAASVLGFLSLNWPPARIFMGDVGSGWLGIVLAGLAVWSVREAGIGALWPWLILGGAFIVDATTCLIRRILTRQPFTEPHRSHAYQNLARSVGTHRPVTVGFIAIGVAWLFPLAIIAAARPESGLLLTVVAYLPLIELALRFRSGVPGVAERSRAGVHVTGNA